MSGIPSWSKSASGAGSGRVKRLFSDLPSDLPSDLRGVAGDDDKKPSPVMDKRPVIDKRIATSKSGPPNNRINRRRRVFISANMRRIIGGGVDLGQDIGNSYWSG